MASMQQLNSLRIAVSERAKDWLRKPPSVSSDTPSQLSYISVQNYESKLPFNPELFGKWHKDISQDSLDTNGDKPLLVTNFDYHGVAISKARILSDGLTHVSIFNAQNQREADYSIHRRLKPPRVLKRTPKYIVPGTTLSLCSPIATLQGNFAHWLVDGLSRMILLEDRASEPVRIDNFLIPENQLSMRESILELGVSNDQIIELPIHTVLEFEHLVCMSRPRGYSSNVTPGWLIQGYRKRLESSMHDPKLANKRLYISRKDAGSRKFRNEDALITELEKRGYQSVELSKLSFREKATLFSQATDVIGLSGAGMMSLIFCPPETRIFEIFPSNFITYSFATVSAFLEHEHHAYIFENEAKKIALDPHSGLFDLDIKDFLNSVDKYIDKG